MNQNRSHRRQSGKKLRSPDSKVMERSSGRSTPRYADHAKDFIFWCSECNVPLIQAKCCTCGQDGRRIVLSQPADVRFCSPYERQLLCEQLIRSFGCDPLGERIVLLNKIPGDDKADEVIVDGLFFGILRFSLQSMDYDFEPMVLGAKVLLEHCAKKVFTLKKSNRHLNGKKLGPDMVVEMSAGIKSGDYVLVVSGNLTGYGVAYCDTEDLRKAGGTVLRIRKVDSQTVSLNPRVSTLDDVIAANVAHLRTLGKNAMNTIKGIANQDPYRSLPVNVSFSGGKDSLVILDLARSALRNVNVKAFFLNTGIEFPETVDFVHEYCRDNDIELVEKKAATGFWDNVETFGPPAKDFRWCCKICKLAPANEAIEECLETAPVCLTIDGKRKYESFSRARIATSEKNPFVPGQLNIFPIRDWRAIEVWLYIYWRGLQYNPLYAMGFERVGCYLCPAALSAEYMRLGDLHPELSEKWNTFLLSWAEKAGVPEQFVTHGMWRWKELPPKMLKFCEDMGISSSFSLQESPFSIKISSGISPCKAGGYTIEGAINGLSMKRAGNIMNILGKATFSEELGVLFATRASSTVKVFSSGSMVINSQTQEKAEKLFAEASRQLVRNHRCTECGICINACPSGAISLTAGEGIIVNEDCTCCGRCTDSCVLIKYENKL
ncbi:phosphoadenosine phosphosulfate reductase domain-containing protein [Methanolobus halotolerans]|uniref:Phosphoadenosine phosphosulfate reductase n=1 Tax=Methanolobus halotolerans TaxID=2052935 RepID=A0A4E0Q3G9_9EURY|nr:phosphoadenosine phosphosulfate reductase family protein [Methanolobus halotolerans]TGC08035.1 phosphoadenosine phosphosulfate reductase [Methanolobus halotolerans]